MPIAQLGLLIDIAESDGITQTELAERHNMHSGTVSRNLKTLSIYVEAGKRKGFDLVEMRPDLIERRKLACYLTGRGKEVMAEVSRLMEK